MNIIKQNSTETFPEYIYLSNKYSQLDNYWYLVSRTKFITGKGKEFSKVEFTLNDAKLKSLMFEQ